MDWLYFGIIASVLALLATDLGVFHPYAHVVRMKEALRVVGGMIAVGVVVSLVLTQRATPT